MRIPALFRPVARRGAVLLAVAVWAACIAAAGLGRLGAMDLRLLDLQFRVRGVRPCPAEIVCLWVDDDALDNDALREAGRNWHWDYATLALLVRELHRSGAKTIGLDLAYLARADWRQRDPSPLVAACREHGGVVLPIRLERVPHRMGPVYTSAARPAPDLAAAAAGAGLINVVPDADGAVHAMPVAADVEAGAPVGSFAAEVVRVFHDLDPADFQPGPDRTAQLGDIEIEVDEFGEMWLNHLGPYRHFAPVSAAKVLLTDEPLQSVFGGKIVLVGSAITGEATAYMTPFSSVLGIELQATAVANLLQGDFLRRPAPWVTPLAGMLLALLCAWVIPAVRPLLGALVAAGIVVGVVVVSAVLFAANVWFPAAAPLATVTLVGLILVGVQVAGLDRRRARQESWLNALVSVGNILTTSISRPELLRAIMQWVQSELDVKASSLLSVDEERGVLSFEIALGPTGEAFLDFELPIGHGIAGTVAQTGEVLVVPDVRADPRWASEYGDAADFETRSILCVPLRIKDRVIGVLEAINKAHDRPFVEEDVRLLSAIAGQAATFMENLKLYEELEERVTLATQELVAANREVASEKSKIDAIVANMADGLIGVDADGRVVVVNRAAEELLGVRGTDLLGQYVQGCLPDRELSQLFLEPLRGRGAVVRELTLGPEGERVVRAQMALVEVGPDVQGKVAVLTDITQLTELDRMKTDLVSFVSHELKNPLTSIKGFASLFAEDVEAGDLANAPSYVPLIVRQAERMERLVADFLSITRVEEGRELEVEWAPLDDVVGIVREVIALEGSSSDRHTFQMSIPAELPPVFADRDKFYQILVNLVNNAVKYSARGGTVTISADARDGDVVFSVADEGTGISEQDMEHLFQKYRRIRRGSTERVAGTGLGLYLTKKLVEAHGGRIWAEGEQGKGATFHFALPTRPPDAP